MIGNARPEITSVRRNALESDPAPEAVVVVVSSNDCRGWIQLRRSGRYGNGRRSRGRGRNLDGLASGTPAGSQHQQTRSARPASCESPRGQLGHVESGVSEILGNRAAAH